MRIAVVGAGVAGLSTAKVLTGLGHEVVVYEKAPDVGGVWSATRRYPGVSTQSPRDTYALSDFPMPKSFPEWPSGEQVQEYLADYARHFDLERMLRLDTEVTSARPRRGGGWTLTTRSAGAETSSEHDHLVIANGVFSQSFVPEYDGAADFAAAGGKLLAASDFHDVSEAAGKHAIVVGYGKSACDVAVRISDVAESTDLIARQMLWKVPRKIGGVLNFKMLLLTRMGEALFRWQHPRGMEKFLHGAGNGIRLRMLGSVEAVTVRQYKLRELDLMPRGHIQDIVRTAIGLVTDGFYERVGDGRIRVRREQTVKRLLEKDGAPHAELADGTLLRADLVVCGTGYRQGISFLEPELEARLKDERGNFMLYRQVLPVDVPDLTFAGYNSSFFSPLNAEMAAIWIGALLAGALPLPGPDALREQVRGRIAFMDEATSGHHSHNTKIIPFSMHNVDELLEDLDLNIGRLTRAGHWLNPVNPKVYRKVAGKLKQRLDQATGPAAPAPSGSRPERVG
jgi:cation diffusion facilitator CzcD-associated flavoprotein CzcO